MAVQISSGNDGLRNLQGIIDRLLQGGYKSDTSVPIVLVSGFSGWGEALFGTFNYWGGFEDLPGSLRDAGYTVIVVRIGPLSSNWERACEVYAQLTASLFDSPDTFPPTSIPVDYGSLYPVQYGYERNSNCNRAVLFGTLPGGWKWSNESPIHCICHSQGGNTIRMLTELLNGPHANLHPSYFAVEDRQNMIKSVVTLGTPHKGTTITDVVQNLLPPYPQDTNLITQLIVSLSFRTPRFYDLQLDHWGFYRLPNESFTQMSTRIGPTVESWWKGTQDSALQPHNGFFDNSIRGVKILNDFADRPASATYYFTMSFDATQPFPEETLAAADLSILPLPFPLSFANPFNILGGVGRRIGAAGLAAATHMPGLPNIVDVARWAVKVANNHLGPLGYFDRIPVPGPKVPRSDMLPLLLVPSEGMGGYDVPAADLARLGPGISSADFQPNNGIVNTVSMRGPNDAYIASSAAFPVQSLGSAASATIAQGMYWHFGTNKTMDHADEIGVFTEGQTYQEIQHMYLLFAQLLTRLP